MPRSSNQAGSARSAEDGVVVALPAGALRFLRYTHIFASVVREVLVVRLLEEVSPSSLTSAQFHLLKVMTRNGQHQLREVAGLLGVSPPAATKNIDKLERLGLVVRTPSKGDRRSTLLSVSPKGRRLVQRYERLAEASLRPVLEGFGEQDLEVFTGLLERFAVELLEAGRGNDRFCLRCAAYLEEGCPVGRARGGCPYQKAPAAQ